MQLAEALTDLVDLMDAPLSVAFARHNRLEAVDDAGEQVSYYQTETNLGLVSVTVGAEDDRVCFMCLQGEADPVQQAGRPTIRWTDAEPWVTAWFATCREARATKVLVSEDNRRMFMLDRPEQPLRITAGPGFPSGPWSEETRGLHMLSYRVRPQTLAEEVPGSVVEENV